MVRVFYSSLERSQVRVTAVSLLSNSNPGQVVRTHVPPSPSSMNKVPVDGRRRPATGKVTVGLASHAPNNTRDK